MERSIDAVTSYQLPVTSYRLPVTRGRQPATGNRQRAHNRQRERSSLMAVTKLGRVLEGTYGVIAEFTEPQELLDAANKAREAGYTELDAYSPFPIHGLAEAIGFHHSR